MTTVKCIEPKATTWLKQILRNLDYRVMGVNSQEFTTDAPQAVIDAASVLVDEHVLASAQ